MDGVVEVCPDPKEGVKDFVLQNAIVGQNTKVQQKNNNMALLSHGDGLSPFIKIRWSIHLLQWLWEANEDNKSKMKGLMVFLANSRSGSSLSTH